MTEDKEQAYVNIIRNFLRRENFRDLLYELENAYITEEQYESAINENPDKYVITINNEGDMKMVYEIMDKIGLEIRELSCADVSEMFSFNIEFPKQ